MSITTHSHVETGSASEEHHMFSKIITSEKLVLRPYEESDVSSWQKWDVDPEVQAFLPEPKNEPTSHEAGIEYLKECENESDGYYWSIVWKDSNILIGTISFTEVSPHHGIGELGIVIGEKEYWGRGVAQEAITDILNFISELGLRRISAEFEEGNIGMEKVLIKLGFRKEAYLKASKIKDGHPINTVRYFYLSSQPEEDQN